MTHAPGCYCKSCSSSSEVALAAGGQVRDPSSHRTPTQIHTMDHGYNRVHQDRIVMRHKARRTLIREGRVEKGDGKDVDHRQMLVSGGSNAPSNWRVRSAHANRGWNKK